MSRPFYTVRPITEWTEPQTPPTKRRSRYTFSTPFSQTESLLRRELEHLAGKDVVLQLAVTEADLRLDGTLRANVRITHPGVKIAFDSKHGPLTYATDSCELWQHNVRSIALGLEALRAVDRYGVTRRGEQYTGWKALPAGSGTTASHMTREDAIVLLAQLHNIPPEFFNTDPESLRSSFRRARREAHPDRVGGSRALWDQVERAGKVLGFI